jgi:hypothetical protein
MTSLSHASPTWKLVFSDPGIDDWESRWFLDGKIATVTNTPEGLVFKTGPVNQGDASHGVLWTHKSFEGDVRIEYDFTRLDNHLNHIAVCILFIHAEGIGKDPFVGDIHAWRELRQIPKMALYFNHMNLYHISYACSGGEDQDYVRARQYPATRGFHEMQIDPSYEKVGFFQPGETWHMVFEKNGSSLSLTASRDDQKRVFHWDLGSRPALTQGRIGLRQMRGRESQIANFKVYQRE